MMWRAYGWHLYATGWQRPRDVAPVVVLSPSTHIAAGAATSTTQRLTGLTGTFTAGRISDDTNALPSIDIGNNGNTELEWCVKFTSSAPEGAIYEFRVTLNGVPLDTYSQTPQVTVGTAAPPEYPFAARHRVLEPDQDLLYVARDSRPLPPTFFIPSTPPFAAAAALAFTTAVVFSGKGAFAAAGSLQFTTTAVWRGHGNVAATGALQFSTSTALRGRGSFLPAGALTFTTAAVLRGRGSLGATAAPAFQVSSVLSGRSPLAATAALSFGVSVTLSQAAAGSLTATSSLQLSVIAVLTGVGTPIVGAAGGSGRPVWRVKRGKTMKELLQELFKEDEEALSAPPSPVPSPKPSTPQIDISRIAHRMTPKPRQLQVRKRDEDEDDDDFLLLS